MSLVTGASFEQVVKDIQQKFSKYVDFRVWNSAIDRVYWTDLLEIVKNTQNIKYVPDNYFSPSVDIRFAKNVFPRFRGFVAYDLSGSIQINQSGSIDPVYYPNEVDQSFTSSIL